MQPSGGTPVNKYLHTSIRTLLAWCLWRGISWVCVMYLITY
nr:MAG TPA: hypothetical protein [Caudoviricetes sp.]DAS92028.1 MAG TPA: hypothetical protein [Caudoviricetes sp.]